MNKRKIIVDTHYLIWDMMGHARFNKQTEKVINQHSGSCYFSSITYWEIGMLLGKGRISLPVTMTQFFDDLKRKRNYGVLPLTSKIGDVTRQFSNAINGDPADRIIVATALAHEAILLTADKNLQAIPFLDTI